MCSFKLQYYVCQWRKSHQWLFSHYDMHCMLVRRVSKKLNPYLRNVHQKKPTSNVCYQDHHAEETRTNHDTVDWKHLESKMYSANWLRFGTFGGKYSNISFVEIVNPFKGTDSACPDFYMKYGVQIRTKLIINWLQWFNSV